MCMNRTVNGFISNEFPSREQIYTVEQGHMVNKRSDCLCLSCWWFTTATSNWKKKKK